MGSWKFRDILKRCGFNTFFKRQGCYKEIGDIGSDTLFKEIGFVKIV